ncbi:MAG: alanine racemase [Propionibacteriaceae bacterium]|jgi:alanine racemase|nr:alanine racemase [Propionibacteriaceae bacterium]
MSEPVTFALVDLGTLGRNLGAIRTATNRPILLPVKANAYGHGLIEVGTTAVNQGWADWLGVATVDEGVALREAGVTAPILKLSGTLASEAAAAVGHGLTLAITELAGAEAANAAALARGVVARVHLKIDTGMRRVGVPDTAAADVAARLEELPGLELEGVFTHLAVSDVPVEDDFTALQLDRFAAAVAAITERLGRRPTIVHAANSGAVLGHPEAWWDLVRPGIMSYGYYPDATTPRSIPVEPVLSWYTHLTQVKTVAAGDTVSYGRTWAPTADTRVGTFPVGYGDGFNRWLSNLGSILIGGGRYPQVGRVCMDQSMADLGPDSTAKTGDRVTLIGTDGAERITADDVAKLLGTISYEVLCNIAHRVPRVHVEA